MEQVVFAFGHWRRWREISHNYIGLGGGFGFRIERSWTTEFLKINFRSRKLTVMGNLPITYSQVVQQINYFPAVHSLLSAPYSLPHQMREIWRWKIDDRTFVLWCSAKNGERVNFIIYARKMWKRRYTSLQPSRTSRRTMTWHDMNERGTEGIEFETHLIVNSILIACRNAKSSCRFN